MIFEALSADRTSDVAVVATFLAEARSSSARADGIAFIDGRDNPSDLPTFSSLVAPCDLKQIYVVMGSSRPDTPIFSEWICPNSSPSIQAGFRVRNGQIENVTFGPLRRVRFPPVSHSQQS